MTINKYLSTKYYLGIILFITVFIINNSSLANALTYQDTLDTSFTFNSSIAITLSSSDLVISELTPNTYADSNIITITAASNNPTGYEVTATAGNGTTFTSTSLIDSENNSNPDSFTSLGTTDSYDISSNDFGYGKWGYTYSTDSGTTWINANSVGYSGLPYYGNTGASIMSSNTAGSSNTDFKIGAKATATQSAGTYNNVVNFAITANPVITTRYMQDVATWGSSLNTGDEVIATDARDNKQYYVAKLADGNIWMTQNLDHDIDSSYPYSSANTDIPSNWSDTLTNTYTTSTWNNSSSTPKSYDPGNRCWNGILDSNWSTTLPKGTVSCSSLTQEPNHYHIGNYYNWAAAIAMTNSGNYTANNNDVDQSICPSGWRLPIGGTTNTGPKSFHYLVNQLSLTSGTSGNIQNAPPYFVYGGYWSGISADVGSGSLYWTSVVSDSSSAYCLRFYVDGDLYPQSDGDRNGGNSIRCVAR